MFSFLRGAPKTRILADAESFWNYVNDTQTLGLTPPERAHAEERRDLKLSQHLKALLEQQVGSEEGVNPVQKQNWDWNDDRTRGIYVIRSAFNPELLPAIQSLLVDEFEDFRVVLMIHEHLDGEMWGGLVITKDLVAIQRRVAQAYAIAV